MYSLQYHHDDFINKISSCLYVRLNGHNYPTWIMDVKISLAFCGILHVLSPPVEREAVFLNTYKYQALFIIRNHLHHDLKSEYVMEGEPHSL
jgi:hypothetical protein